MRPELRDIENTPFVVVGGGMCEDCRCRNTKTHASNSAALPATAANNLPTKLIIPRCAKHTTEANHTPARRPQNSCTTEVSGASRRGTTCWPTWLE